jgi:hypothetical protein
MTTTKTIRRAWRVVLVAVLLAVPAAAMGGIAEAAPAPAAPAESTGIQRSTAPPLARLEVSLTPLASPTPGRDTVTLTCGPDGGTHPTPKAACDSLRRVGGNFNRLPNVPGGGCPAIFDPHLARATGYWQQSPTGPVIVVDYSETFGNRCRAAIGTDNVFRF